MSFLRLITGFAIASVLAACGGGGGDSGGAGTTPPPVANALNGNYKVMTATGSTLTVAVDLDAKTLGYTQNGTAIAGTLTASNGEWLLSAPANGVTGARLVLKNGFFFGALPDQDAVGTWVAVPSAGARDDLIVKDVSQLAGHYYNLRLTPCLVSAVSCANDSLYPGQLAIASVSGSTTESTVLTCNSIPAPASGGLLKAWLLADPATNGCLANNTLTRTWTADAQGVITSSSVVAPSTFQALFARVNGKVTGFSSNRTLNGATVSGYTLGLILPISANTAASYVGVGPVGLMNRTARTFAQGDYNSAAGTSASLTVETGASTFSVEPEALATGVATVNNDPGMALFSDGRFGVWFSDSATTGGLSLVLGMFK